MPDPAIGARLFEAARKCDVTALARMLDESPALLEVREPPYQWTLLHAASRDGCLEVVDLLLARGLDVNSTEEGDNTTPLHWAAAAGHVDVVHRLIEAGADVVGRGDDHQLDVIGWTTCWEGCDDEAHARIVEMLIEHGAQHHIFSAIAMNLGDELVKIARDDPSALNRRMSRNENNATPLHFAVRMNRPEMVSLLVKLGSDPLATDFSGQHPAWYANAPDVDRSAMEAIHSLTLAEIDSARRGKRPAQANATDLVAALALRDEASAVTILRDNPDCIRTGALHLAARRGDSFAVTWLLDNGADPNLLCRHGGSELTALHMAIMSGNEDAAKLLLERGADPRIRDTKHDGDAMGWAEHFGQEKLLRLIQSASGG